MDSGNSGSLQSSSGGDEEYDSRAAAGSIFMNNTHALGPISNSLPPPPSPQFNFDPFSNFMQLHHPNPAWPRPASFRSDPNSSTHHDINNNNPMLSAGSSNFTHSLRPPPAVGEVNNSSSSGGVAPTNHAAARNPRKRSRASRRAPTTVLTTDTSNFRAMVQEFTGIPAAPPFINNSLFPRSSGLDLFGPRSAASFEAPPPRPYLRRPFVQKDQSPPQQFLGSNAAIDGGGMGGSSTANNNNISSAVSSTLLSTTQGWNLFSNDVVPNPLVTQTNRNYLFSNSSDMATNLMSSDQIAAQSDFGNHKDITDHNKSIAAARRWRNNNYNNGVMNNPDHGDDHDYNQADHRMKLGGGSRNFSRSTMNGKMMSYSGEKGPPENIATTTARGSEGMVESWICSSSE